MAQINTERAEVNEWRNHYWEHTILPTKEDGRIKEREREKNPQDPDPNLVKDNSILPPFCCWSGSRSAAQKV